MHVIFLDIDGVLNSMGYVIGKSKPFMNADYLQTNGANLDPHAVSILKDGMALFHPHAKIVLSSSWRTNNSEYELDKWRGGMETHFDWPDFPIIDVTPRCMGERRHEIQNWLDNTTHDVDDFIVIDDESDAWHEIPSRHFHKTDMLSGLTYSFLFWLELRDNPAMLASHFPRLKRIV